MTEIKQRNYSMGKAQKSKHREEYPVFTGIYDEVNPEV
jgi:hypothetical protein